MTKEERFLLKLYELSLASDEPLDPIEAGRLIGIAPKGVKTICKNLAQANFIQKEGEEWVSLTRHGKNLAEELP